MRIHNLTAMATLQRVIVLALLMAVALADQPVQFNCTTVQQSDLAKGVTWQQMNWFASAFIFPVDFPANMLNA